MNAPPARYVAGLVADALAEVLRSGAPPGVIAELAARLDGYLLNAGIGWERRHPVVQVAPGAPALTDADRHLLTLIARGRTLPSIAAERGCHVRTLFRQLAAIRRELGAPSLPAAVGIATHLGQIRFDTEEKT